jgi:hypothetical protein
MNDNNQPPNHPPGDENTNGEKQPTGGSPQKPALTPAQIHEIDRAEDREFNEDRFRALEKRLEKAQASVGALAKRTGDLERDNDQLKARQPQTSHSPDSATAPIQTAVRSEPWWIPALWIAGVILFVLLFCHFALGSDNQKNDLPENPFATSVVVPRSANLLQGGAS